MAAIAQSKITLLVPHLLGEFLECILYGLYLTTLGSWVKIVHSHRKSQQPLRWWLIAIVLWMFILGTTDVAIAVGAYIVTSIESQGGTVSPSLSIFASVMRFLCLVAQGIVGDAVLLYRCYVIWGRRWYVVIFSAAVWLSEVGCCVASLYAWLGQPLLGTQTKRIEPFLISTGILTLIFNLATTSLLVYAILRVDRQTKYMFPSAQNTHLSRFSRVFIETGLIYTSSLVVVVVFYCASYDLSVVAVPCTIQIAGIMFTLLIIRIDAELSGRSDINVGTSHSQPGVNPPGRTILGTRDAVRGGPSAHCPVEVEINEETHMDVIHLHNYALESDPV